MSTSALSDNYDIVRLLGEGANGKTWLAVKRDTHEKVAVKQLRLSKIQNMKSYELFEREVEVLKSVESIGVPKYYDCVKNEDGDICLVQQYIEAPSLMTYIEEHGTLPEKIVIEVMLQVTSILISLQTQYAPPIVHRDIKPSNILCEIDMKKETVSKLYLIDFGAVANPQKKSSGSTVAGTFGYMSPEQLLGDVTIQSDYYALGATALHCLCGIAPYELPTDMFSIQLDDVFDKLASSASPQMRRMIAILLAPVASDRPKNARSLRDMLRNVRDGRMPEISQEESICDQYLRSLQENRTDVNTYVIKSSDMARWAVSHALARRVATISINGTSVSCIEYTFEVLDETWSGVCPVNDVITKNENYQKSKFPFDITICYDPSNPRYNCLYKK